LEIFEGKLYVASEELTLYSNPEKSFSTLSI